MILFPNEKENESLSRYKCIRQNISSRKGTEKFTKYLTGISEELFLTTSDILK